MAGKTFIADISDQKRLTGSFLVQQKQVPLNKNGKPYIAMTLMDRTGALQARVWDNVDKYESLFEAGDCIEISAVGVSYQGRLQLKVETVKKLQSEEVELDEFLPASSRDRGQMLDRLRELLDTIHNNPLRDMLLVHLDDDDFRSRFTRAPAAKTIHHAFLGGLLEHTLSVVELADRMAAIYTDLDRDLLLAGAFLHDVGKIRELGCETSFEYTDAGRLLGHIYIGAAMVQEWAAAEPGLDEEYALKLVHMILSHHGSYEFGSPRRPKFVEALVLNYLDELDSKVESFTEIAEREKGQRWSSFQRVFDRYLFLGQPKPAQQTREDQTGETSRDKPLAHNPFEKQLEQSGLAVQDEKKMSSKQMTLGPAASRGREDTDP
ncbi:MAG TPA: HD domain-containing protein [Myxococcota bacterium]|nr:HD domain-containing protein [Myxococcota bacterium]